MRDNLKYLKTQAKLSIGYFCSSIFSGSHVTKYINTQKLNCKCQEFDPTILLSHLYPSGGFFTPPSEFLPHLENFSPNPKIVRNTIIIANANIFTGQKNLPTLICTLPPLSPKKRSHPPPTIFTVWEIFLFLIRFELQNFYPRGKIFEFDNKYIVRCLLLEYLLIILLVFLYTFKTHKSTSLFFKGRHLILLYIIICFKPNTILQKGSYQTNEAM